MRHHVYIRENDMREGFIGFMWRRTCVVLAVSTLTVVVAPITARAQSRDSLYRRAQGMVSNGDAATGRALVDSLLNTTQEGTSQYAQGLYWRATLAASSTDAEHDYQRIVVDYPLSPWADDALLRLGELELMQGDYDAALLHLQRLTRDHPNSPLRAKASYWTARTFFEKGDASEACAANDDALAHAAKSDIELKNQINYQHQRCRTVAMQPTAPPPANTTVASNTPPTPPTPAGTATESIPPSPPSPPTSASESRSRHGRERSTRPTPTTRHGKASKSTSPVPSLEKPTGAYGVQVAAYYDRSQANWFAEKLRKRGYAAHVDGSAAPFRVRIGHYTTHAAAATALVKLKAKQIDGFVTKE